jgi:ribonuclease G
LPLSGAPPILDHSGFSSAVRFVKKLIVLNCTPQETRVAVLESGRLAEIYIERLKERGTVGNIYKGRVQRVLPGMQAAFVDIGFEKAAFLHASDFQHEIDELSPLLRDSAEEPEADLAEDELESRERPGEFAVESVPEADGGVEATPASGQREIPRRPRRRTRRVPIESRLSKGAEILVQVSKEPMGTKGPRVTSYVSLAGRYLVYMPTTNHIGVSRRIADPEERRRLKELVTSLRPPEGGFIVRTVCEGLQRREIQADIEYLTRTWERIQRKSETVSAPALLYKEMDLVERTVRDLFTPEVGRVIVDSEREFRRLQDLVEAIAPRLKGRVQIHEGPEPVFERYGIEEQLDRALDRKVWLRSGGYLIIEQTEALTAIDVNTGRYVGRRDQEETILRTNLEAAEEIVHQLRLRNIGGLIIIDFIDMEKPENRRQVNEALCEAVRRRDKAQTKILKISELGLVEMTRKRTRESLEQALCSPCPHCEGRGWTKSPSTVAYALLRRLEHAAARDGAATRLLVKASPTVASFLYDSEGRVLDQLEKTLGKKIVLKAEESFRPEQYEILLQ